MRNTQAVPVATVARPKPVGKRQFLKAIEVAQMFGVSPGAVREWRLSGGLPYIEPAPESYFYPVDALTEWIKARSRNVER